MSLSFPVFPCIVYCIFLPPLTLFTWVNILFIFLHFCLFPSSVCLPFVFFCDASLRYYFSLITFSLFSCTLSSVSLTVCFSLFIPPSMMKLQNQLINNA
jgi:hypothetical protein